MLLVLREFLPLLGTCHALLDVRRGGSGAGFPSNRTTTSGAHHRRRNAALRARSTSAPEENGLCGTSRFKYSRIRADERADVRCSRARHDAPVLAAWGGDGARVFTGGGDKMVQRRDWRRTSACRSRSTTRRSSRSSGCSAMNCIVTAGWDKTVRYWTARASTPKATLQLPERACLHGRKYPLMVVGTADRRVGSSST